MCLLLSISVSSVLFWLLFIFFDLLLLSWLLLLLLFLLLLLDVDNIMIKNQIQVMVKMAAVLIKALLAYYSYNLLTRVKEIDSPG